MFLLYEKKLYFCNRYDRSRFPLNSAPERSSSFFSIYILFYAIH